MTVLMCPPAHFTVRDVKNPFMEGSVVDVELAARQWHALREAFKTAGLDTAIIEAVEDLEDMVFTANQTFVGLFEGVGRFVVPSRMRFESREREVPHYVAWFQERGYEICDLRLRGDEYLEGHGDLVPHPGRALVWAGHGYRSSRAGVERAAGLLAGKGIATARLELIDPTFYHLDTCFCTLGSDAALYYPGAFSAGSIERLRAGWPRLYEVSREEALQFVCNGVAVNGRFVASRAPGAVARALAREGLEPLLVDLSEFEKAGGSAFCLKTFVA